MSNCNLCQFTVNGNVCNSPEDSIWHHCSAGWACNYQPGHAPSFGCHPFQDAKVKFHSYSPQLLPHFPTTGVDVALALKYSGPAEKSSGESKLREAWDQRKKLRAEGSKLRAEGYKLWAEGSKLRAEGDKLCADGNKLCVDGNKLWAEGSKLRAEGDKLWAEGSKLRAEDDKLWAEGDKLWVEAVLEVHGNVVIDWDQWPSCLVEGVKYE